MIMTLILLFFFRLMLSVNPGKSLFVVDSTLKEKTKFQLTLTLLDSFLSGPRLGDRMPRMRRNSSIRQPPSLDCFSVHHLETVRIQHHGLVISCWLHIDISRKRCGPIT